MVAGCECDACINTQLFSWLFGYLLYSYGMWRTEADFPGCGTTRHMLWGLYSTCPRVTGIKSSMRTSEVERREEGKAHEYLV